MIGVVRAGAAELSEVSSNAVLSWPVDTSDAHDVFTLVTLPLLERRYLSALGLGCLAQ